MDTLDFLRQLYWSNPNGAGVVELRSLSNETGRIVDRLFTSDADDIRRFARRHDAGYAASAYFGVGLRTGIPRLNPKTGRVGPQGTKEDVSLISALWADVDVDKMGWDVNRTLGLIKGHELRPSVIVNSGHGLHLYWMLETPFVMQDMEFPDTLTKRIEKAMHQLSEVFSGDHTHDITRVLRLPGTFNTKGKPLPVRVVMADWKEYDFQDLLEQSADTNKLLDKDGWLSREQMKAKIKAEREKAGIIGAAGRFANDLGLKPRKLGWDQIWQLTKYGGGEHGSAFIGIDEAILRGVGHLCAHQPHWTDEQIIDAVMFEVQQVKAKQAPHENWNWNEERREIADKLRRCRERWEEFLTQGSKDSGGRRGKHR